MLLPADAIPANPAMSARVRRGCHCAVTGLGNASVTAHGEHAAVNTPPPRTGLCIVRLEEQAGGLLITVLNTLDTHAASGQTRRAFVDVDDAVGHVREFIQAFTRSLLEVKPRAKFSPASLYT